MNVKNGFSTLNRLLGKKNKSNQLSKSSSKLNLSIASNSIDTITPINEQISSQLEQDRITPLPVAVNNAPFEQTFRITVLLPKCQLYVARLGAKTKLDKLLELVCENKQLDPEKYEFRHPVDTSQVFSNELTIGAVGLTEIRLCNKSETYDNYNADEIIKLRHNTIGRDSMSSSEFSSRNSKHTIKTTSPYSSTNSLNSIDSSGMNTIHHHHIHNRVHIVSLPPQINNNIEQLNSFIRPSQSPPVAPTRKKRIAPGPPSQNSEEKSTTKLSSNDDLSQKIITSTMTTSTSSDFKQPLSLRKDFHVSSPNLTQGNNNELLSMLSLSGADFHKSNISMDCNESTNHSKNNNNNTSSISNICLSQSEHYNRDINKKSSIVDINGFSLTKRPASMTVINNVSEYFENDLRDSRRSYAAGTIPDYEVNNSTTNESSQIPAPLPRKRIFTAKKKAPAPPPRNLPPIAPPRATTMANIQEVVKYEDKPKENIPNINNILKVMLNASTGIEKEEYTDNEHLAVDEMKENINELLTEIIKVNVVETDNSIRLPEKDTEIFNSQQEKLNLESTTSIEHSSEEEENDRVNVNNLKLGKAIVKPLKEFKSSDVNVTGILDLNNTTEPIKQHPIIDSIRSDSLEWTYAIPAPPNFADISSTASFDRIISDTEDLSIISDYNLIMKSSNSPIKASPIIKEQTPLIFEELSESKRTMSIKVEGNINDDNDNNIIITSSDIEDGYHGGGNDEKSHMKFSRQALLEDLNKTPTTEIVTNNDNSSFENSTNSLDNFDDYNKTDNNINELHKVMENGGFENIVHHKSNDVENIQAVKPCSLRNFKIQPYTNNNNQLEKNFRTLLIENSDNKRTNDVDNKESNLIRNDDDGKFMKKTLHTTKRRSLTFNNNNTNNNTTSQLFRTTRSNIKRSDSFHSTNQQQNNTINDTNNINTRSSSYLSLIGVQKFDITNTFSDAIRRKSSSELSIGESPSLQSLIVIKSIINSRKNSLSNDGNEYLQQQKRQEDKLNDVFYKNQLKASSSLSSLTIGFNINNTFNNNELNDRNFVDDKTTCINNNNNNSSCDSSKENSPKNKIISQNIINNNYRNNNSNNNKNDNNINGNEKQDQPEKKWKYSGPPSINLSTWSDRPKVQVSIKNDNDYKFGVGNNKNNNNNNNNNNIVTSTLPRTFRNSTIMNIDTATSSPTTSSTTTVRIVSEQPKIPFVRSVEYKKIPIEIKSVINSNNNNNSNNIINNDSTISLNGGNTMTLGRPIPKINRTTSTTIKKHVPIVKGFKNIENFSKTDHKNHINNNNNSRSQLINSSKNSMNHDNSNNTNINTNTIYSTIPERSNSFHVTAPEEKHSILKFSEYTNNNYNNINNITIPSKSDEINISAKNSLQSNLNCQYDNQDTINTIQFSQVILRRTGLKEKILAKDETYDQKSLYTGTNKKETKFNLSDLGTTIGLNERIRHQKPEYQQQTTPTKTPTPPPAPPPIPTTVPPSIIRSVVTKHNSLETKLLDPREQLLYSIKNFNKNLLKQAKL